MGNPHPGGMGPGMNPPPPPRRNHWHGGYHRSYYGGGCLTNMVSGIVIFIVFIFIIIASMGSCSARTVGGIFGSNKTNVNVNNTSSVTREKLKTSGSFDNSCIIDELGWFDDVKSAEKNLKTFYDKTGVQPYVLLKEYDSSLIDDYSLDEYSYDYYVDNIVNEDSFLFVYIDGANGDFGNYMYVVGDNAATVMDDTAINIFFDYIDEYWDDGSISTDDMFVNAFNNTATRIMGNSDSSSSSSSKTKKSGVWKFVAIVFVILIAFWAAKKYKKKEETVSTTPTDESKDNPNILN
jgi:hypothetical protein